MAFQCFQKLRITGLNVYLKCSYWLLYLALELLPLTLFYALVLVFNFSATRPPLTAFIFYCQLFPLMYDKLYYIKHLFRIRTNHTFLYWTWTVTDLWNLNFLRYHIIPSFCVSDHFNRTIHGIFLELISAFYPLLLITVTSVLIEMHDRNFKMVVCLWKPFHKCFAHFRRSWDPRSSVINAFTTFLLLSSFKIGFVTLNLTYQTYLGTHYSNGSSVYESVLYIEPSVKYTSLWKQAFFVPIIFLITVFVFLPLFLLAVYPTKAFRKATQCICTRRQRNTLFMIMESFQGYYKDGTTGTYDYRCASCIGFLLRVLVWIALARTGSQEEVERNSSVTFIAICLLAASLFYSNVRPCKERYMNVFESLLYATAAVLLILIIHNHHFPPIYHIILAAILFPSIVYMAVMLLRVLKVVGVLQKVKRLIRRGAKTEVVVNAEPHRLTHPTQYTPLLE